MLIRKVLDRLTLVRLKGLLLKARGHAGLLLNYRIQTQLRINNEI